MIISTRENQQSRERVLHLGISQISGGSRTSVGGYCEPEPEDEKSEQFDVSDTRTLDEVVRWLMEMDYIPSFCTACYGKAVPVTASCRCVKVDRSRTAATQMP